MPVDRSKVFRVRTCDPRAILELQLGTNARPALGQPARYWLVVDVYCLTDANALFAPDGTPLESTDLFGRRWWEFDVHLRGADENGKTTWEADAVDFAPLLAGKAAAALLPA
jgi:hypothetical protein